MDIKQLCTKKESPIRYERKVMSNVKHLSGQQANYELMMLLVAMK